MLRHPQVQGAAHATDSAALVASVRGRGAAGGELHCGGGGHGAPAALHAPMVRVFHCTSWSRRVLESIRALTAPESESSGAYSRRTPYYLVVSGRRLPSVFGILSFSRGFSLYACMFWLSRAGDGACQKNQQGGDGHAHQPWTRGPVRAHDLPARGSVGGCGLVAPGPAGSLRKGRHRAAARHAAPAALAQLQGIYSS